MGTTTKLLIISGLILAGAVATLMLLAPQQRANVTASGTAQIGGAFSLIGTKGETVTDKDFRGKYMLIYFGYTFCPDVCPTELSAISEALDKLGPLANRITPLFISIDPERDRPKLVGEYVSNFYKTYVGLTGSKAQIKQVTKAYKVFYSKGKSTEPGEYTMDHSSIIYLMDPKGEYVAFFSYGTAPKIMAQKMAKLIDK